MTGFVNFFAPRTPFDFLLKLVLIEALIVLFALSTMMLIHGSFPFGVKQQILDTLLMGLPFVVLALFITSHQYKLQQCLMRMATTDILTGLNNRRGFFEMAAPWIEQNRGGALILADVDFFKAINDDFGHAVGDRCLSAVAKRLREVTGQSDVVARIGGEEFALCIAPRSASDTEEIARALIEGINVDVLRDRALTLSLGGVYIKDGQALDQLLRYADRHMYRAKEGGRARFVIE